MMKVFQTILVLLCIVVGYWAAFSRNAPRAISSAALEEALAAHGGRESIQSIQAFRGTGTRLTTMSPPGFFERRFVIEVEGEKWRRQISDPLGHNIRIEAFDGKEGRTRISDPREPAETIPQIHTMGEERTRAARFNIETHGLLPLLRRIGEPTTEMISQETPSSQFNQFRIRTSDGEWNIYTDESRLIRKVEIGDKTFWFADYRTIGALRLPFIERLSVGSKLVNEVVLSAIELNPRFPADHFRLEGPRL